jgi:predicted transcriptional regulator
MRISLHKTQILSLRQQGNSSREISSRLGVPYATVKYHVRRLEMPASVQEFTRTIEKALSEAPDGLDVSDIKSAINRIRTKRPVQKYKEVYEIVLRLIRDEGCAVVLDFADELVLSEDKTRKILNEMVRVGLLIEQPNYPHPIQYLINDNC